MNIIRHPQNSVGSYLSPFIDGLVVAFWGSLKQQQPNSLVGCRVLALMQAVALR